MIQSFFTNNPNINSIQIPKQFSSSLSFFVESFSPQSSTPLQTKFLLMHLLFKHLNSWSSHWISKKNQINWRAYSFCQFKCNYCDVIQFLIETIITMTYAFQFIATISTIVNTIAFPSLGNTFFVFAKKLISVTLTTSFKI